MIVPVELVVILDHVAGRKRLAQALLVGSTGRHAERVVVRAGEVSQRDRAGSGGQRMARVRLPGQHVDVQPRRREDVARAPVTGRLHGHRVAHIRRATAHSSMPLWVPSVMMICSVSQ